MTTADQVKIDRSARSGTTRVKEERKKSWVRPSDLDAPPAPPGYRHRWIRKEAGGTDDSKNVAGKLREGYELVRAEEYPDFVVPSIQNGIHAGVIGVGDVVLARIPDEIADERRAYYNQRTSDQIQAVDNDLMKANAHSTMQVVKPERQSRVTFGGPRKAED
jgi:hypothetical protein